jgi:hypothetical protein
MRMHRRLIFMAILPGKTIGILGGGQLGRMLSLAAARLGLRCHIYAPKGDNPAFDVAARRTEADYDDVTALDRFAQDVDVITYEFENVPAQTAAFLSPKTGCSKSRSYPSLGYGLPTSHKSTMRRCSPTPLQRSAGRQS